MIPDSEYIEMLLMEIVKNILEKRLTSLESGV